MAPGNYLILAIFLFVMVHEMVSEAQEQSVSVNTQFCTFFNNRGPKPQSNLKNCTWFKTNSCCVQEEIDACFATVKPLPGASPACQQYTNYLMCYICAPNQNSFYYRESLTVCEDFCNLWYAACRSAILKGSVISSLYTNGKDFCKSRSFEVASDDTSKCYMFDSRMDTSNGVVSNERGVYSLIIGTLIIALAGIFIRT